MSVIEEFGEVVFYVSAQFKELPRWCDDDLLDHVLDSSQNIPVGWRNRLDGPWVEEPHWILGPFTEIAGHVMLRPVAWYGRAKV